MTDPVLAEKLAATQAEALTSSSAITDRVEAKSRELAAESERMRQENEEFCKEMDKRAEDKAAAREDPSSRNQWLHRGEATDNTYRFGAEDEEPEGPTQST